MHRLRSPDVLLIILAVTTGATDATAFERLGNAFASVVTGNFVLLGVGAARGDGRAALVAGCAIAGYAIGVFVAAPRDPDPSGPRPPWPSAATRALNIDLALLLVVGVWWEISDCQPGRGPQVVLLALAAAAMGVQSTAIRRLGPVSTTYLTSTFIGVVEALARRDLKAEHHRSIAIVLAAIAGAAAATGLIVSAQRLVPLLIVAPLLLVIVVASRFPPQPSLA